MAYEPSTAQFLRSCIDSGLAVHRAGDVEGALGAYRQALAVSPEHAPALNLLGTGLLQLGRAEEALPYLERAARRQRGDANLLANLAQAYLALERYDEASENFRKASRIAPREARYPVGNAAALALQGRLAEAKTLLTKLATRFPDTALVWLNLGNVLRDEQNYEAALEAYRKALAVDPRLVDARNSVGSILHTMLRFSDAEREYRACIEAAPDNLIPRYNLASVTMDLGKFAEAEAVCRDIVTRAPQLADAHRMLGTALGHQGRLLDALACYKRAAELAPTDPQTARTYGTALMEAGDSARGLRWLALAETLEPDSIGLKQVTSGALLAHGYLQDGWSAYTYRPARLELSEKYRAFPCMESLPQDLSGKHVCVLAEQGLGDQLFFLRYAAVLKVHGARVTHRSTPKLHGLLQRANELDAVLPEDAELPPADAYVLLGDLPRALGELPSSELPRTPFAVENRRRDFARSIRVFWPHPAPTLRIAPLPERVAELRQRLQRFGPPPYIGVTWRAGTAPEKQHTSAWLLYKHIDLRALATVFEGVRGTIIALQRKPDPGELDEFAAALERPVHDLTALNNDLEGMAAALALLDEYVGVSNTNMHLRAAVGRTAAVLVPVPAEWRWMQSGRRSPWFPGFLIFRQSLQADWNHALCALREHLQMNYASAPASNTASGD